ncbi:MAG: ABC transporter ATP-binding protein [Candidatus Thermoplasmatota archaeon]|nr:ABC transporter ATP-binding protein [Candidatus Thermoplasmatota archaeon]
MPDYAIEVRNLKKSYGNFTAVNGISFNVRKGEIFSLLGPNGAGKTTTIEIMEGVRTRDSGIVSILGIDPGKDRKALLNIAGILPQDFNFINNVTPMESLRFYIGSMSAESDPMELLAMVELDDKSNTVFEKLSGGQKQKLGLAMSLVNDPEVIFLDEPTAGLDPISRRTIWKVIGDLKKRGKSIVLTTHYLEEAENLADYVSIINHGEIVANGSPSDIVRENHDHDTMVVHVDDQTVMRGIDLGVNYTIQGNSVTISLTENAQFFSVVEKFRQLGINITDLTLKRESLEDVFIRMVNGDNSNEN